MSVPPIDEANRAAPAPPSPSPARSAQAPSGHEAPPAHERPARPMAAVALLSDTLPPPRRHGRWWGLLVLLALLLVAGVLSLLTTQQEDSGQIRRILQADTQWVTQLLRVQLNRHEESLRELAEAESGQLADERLFRQRARVLIDRVDSLDYIALLGPDERPIAVVTRAGVRIDETRIGQTTYNAAQMARQLSMGIYSAAYPIPDNDPQPDYRLDLYLPAVTVDGQTAPQEQWPSPTPLAPRMIIAAFSLRSLLAENVPPWFARDQELTLASFGGDALVVQAQGGPGRGIYAAESPLELPGVTLILRSNSTRDAPELLPNVLLASSGLLALALAWSLFALYRDMAQRYDAESQLRAQATVRKAMEDSLITGLRARDLEGRITYVNPAFCRMVGYEADELVGTPAPAPYWSPEEYPRQRQRLEQRLAGRWSPDGFETVFMHKNGQRVHVLIYEAPLLDPAGVQTGWMSSILDITDRKRVEDLARQQQEKLQNTARLVTMGEIASTLAHELNQPLSAITSYATACRNLLDDDAPDARTHMDAALERIGNQAQRTGQVIRSVLDFVRKREPQREPCSIDSVLSTVQPLLELMCRKAQVKLDIEVAGTLPLIHADRVLLEQVLLNLARNGVDAMQDTPATERRLRIAVALMSPADVRETRVCFSVYDAGSGIAPEVEERLFSAFFSTKAEGLGVGLNLSRSIIEFHGGSLWFERIGDPQEGWRTVFRFILPPWEAQAAVPPPPEKAPGQTPTETRP